MSKRLRAVFMLIAFAALSAVAVAEGSMSVQVDGAALRASPSNLGKLVVKIPYATTVTTGKAENGWYPVTTADGKKGWMHSSALTAKKLALKSGGKTASGVSNDEVALAGKGFNKEVEAKYAKDKKVDFTMVNRMETFIVGDPDISAFVDEGGLKR